MRVRQSAPLLVVVFAVAVGLLGMHTVGHDLATRAPAARSALAGHTALDHARDQMMPADVQVGIAADSHGGHGMPAGAVAVCLAVLFATAVLVGLILCGVGRGLAERVGGPLSGTAAAVRGPPPLRLGLRLAELSVLRN